MSKFSDKINAIEVDPEILEEVLGRISELAPEDRGFVGSSITAVHVVNDLGLPDGERQDMCLALNFRLRALAKLISENGAAGWTMPGADGATFIHQEVIERAASQPLCEEGEDLFFDPEEFSAGLLLNTEIGGSA
ncbi:hypothetical protein [Erythrobacter sp.]|uniref:hypothetical protein n=1 Tax=Erythrobacter sp. TaxID=1042 RepID=UPI001425F03A|nr:hypothetical protein [Erythrobacter sp.]QIQ86834.1 MAG: hypothetical protein G9473_09170 [Erythrobacter sp.]